MEPLLTQRRNGGWMLLETVAGLAVLGTLAYCVAVLAAEYRQVNHVMADHRSALRLAERTAMDLQSRRAPAPIPEGAVVKVESLGDAEGAPRWQWTRITAHVEGREGSLIALTPRPQPGESQP